MATKAWPKTSDKEFSKRMFINFMWAFFIHTVLTIIGELVFNALGSAVEVYTTAIPVYTMVFGAVIAKSGVENVYKGKTQVTTQSTTTSEDNAG